MSSPFFEAFLFLLEDRVRHGDGPTSEQATRKLQALQDFVRETTAGIAAEEAPLSAEPPDPESAERWR